jgi:hypothetical protein
MKDQLFRYDFQTFILEQGGDVDSDAVAFEFFVDLLIGKRARDFVTSVSDELCLRAIATVMNTTIYIVDNDRTVAFRPEKHDESPNSSSAFFLDDSKRPRPSVAFLSYSSRFSQPVNGRYKTVVLNKSDFDLLQPPATDRVDSSETSSEQKHNADPENSSPPCSQN